MALCACNKQGAWFIVAERRRWRRGASSVYCSTGVVRPSARTVLDDVVGEVRAEGVLQASSVRREDGGERVHVVVHLHLAVTEAPSRVCVGTRMEGSLARLLVLVDRAESRRVRLSEPRCVCFLQVRRSISSVPLLPSGLRYLGCSGRRVSGRGSRGGLRVATLAAVGCSSRRWRSSNALEVPKRRANDLHAAWTLATACSPEEPQPQGVG